MQGRQGARPIMRFLAAFAFALFSLCHGTLIGSSIDDIKKVEHIPELDTLTDISPLEDMSTPEIIQYFGYPAEVYHVVTEDNYTLELHRIPHGINGSTGGARPVAFLQHGLLCSSSDWVMDYPDRALAYLLADAGYDVWMNNVRGNTYSRNHKTLNPNGKGFWQFTWHDSAVYDLTAAIDFALVKTGQFQVYYVGFSMGTTMLFALMDTKNEYADKIVAAALMGPIGYDYHMKGPMRIFANYSNDLDMVMSLTGHSEVLPSGPVMEHLAEKFCAFPEMTQILCENLLFLVAGFDPEEMNKEWLSIILSHTPAGTSVHTINHYAQLITKGTFQNYDWGRIGNINHYGSNKVPSYKLGVRTPPVALYWGQNDWLADPKDLAKTASELKNVVINHKVEWGKWNHLDFIWGLRAKEYVYDYVMEFLSQY